MTLPAPFGLWQLSLCDSATGVTGGVGKTEGGLAEVRSVAMDCNAKYWSWLYPVMRKFS